MSPLDRSLYEHELTALGAMAPRDPAGDGDLADGGPAAHVALDALGLPAETTEAIRRFAVHTPWKLFLPDGTPERPAPVP